MSKTTTTNGMVTINVNGVNITCTQEQAIAIAMACGGSSKESETPKKTSTPSKTSKKSKKTTPKTSSKKSETSKKQTYEEHLTEMFGSKEDRAKFVELRKKVASEFLALAKDSGKYIPKKSYKKVLNDTTVSLNGRFNKKTIKASFEASAK